MLNEDKIELVTSTFIFEKKEGRGVFPVSRYLREDYVGNHMVRSFVGYVFCWILGITVWILYKVELPFSAEVLDNVWKTLALYGMLCGGGLMLYLMAVYTVCNRRYKHSSPDMKTYLTGLRRLSKCYEYQNKTRNVTREGGRTRLNCLY